MLCHIPVRDPPRAHVQDHEHVEHAKCCAHRDKEIAGEQGSRMISDKRAPCLRIGPRARYRPRRQIAPDGTWRRTNPQLQKDLRRNPFPSGAKTPPTSDHPIIGGSTEPEKGVYLRKFGRIAIVLEPAQRLGHPSAMDSLPPPLA